jgi:choline-sulfatase
MPQTRQSSDIDRPNVLFVMVDQLPPGLTGTYGHDVVETPNLDRLAADGVRFDAAYTPCPLCGPARDSVVTGRHVSAIGAWDNATPLSDDAVTYGHYLSREGYDPVLSGKMHFVGADQLHGFDRRLTTDIYPADFRWTPYRDVDGGEVGREPQAIGGHASLYVDEGVEVDRWSEYLSYDEETHFRALEYLHARGEEREGGESRADDGDEDESGGEGFEEDDDGAQPFHLTVSYHHPHDPFWPPQEYWEQYADAPIDLPEVPDDMVAHRSAMDEWLNEWHETAEYDLLDPESLRRVRRAYYGLVSYVDDKLGELLDALEENGLAEDTVVIFTSDHGDMLCERGMVQKRCFYEPSSRVPLVARFPDGRYAGETCETPVSLLDLLPTFLDLAGVEEADRLPCDGRSLLETLEGDADDRVVFSEYHGEGVRAPCFMARRGDHKYVHVHGHDQQLFDLSEDPDEWTDLSGERTGVVEELRSEILDTFDPESIADAVTKSIRRRTLVHDAMETSGTDWAHEPRFDPTKNILDQYRPG